MPKRSPEGPALDRTGESRPSRESKYARLSPELRAKLEEQKFAVGDNIKRLGAEGQLVSWQVTHVDEDQSKIGIEEWVDSDTQHLRQLSLDKMQLALEQVSLPLVSYIQPYYEEVVAKILNNRRRRSSKHELEKQIDRFKREIFLNTAVSLLNNSSPGFPQDIGREQMLVLVEGIINKVLTTFAKDLKAGPEVSRPSPEAEPTGDTEPSLTTAEVAEANREEAAKSAEEIAQEQARIRAVVLQGMIDNGINPVEAKTYAEPEGEPTEPRNNTLFNSEVPTLPPLEEIPSFDMPLLAFFGREDLRRIDALDPDTDGLLRLFEDEAEGLKQAEAAIEEQKPDKRAVLKAIIHRGQVAVQEFMGLIRKLSGLTGEQKQRLLDIRAQHQDELARAAAKLAYEQANTDPYADAKSARQSTEYTPRPLDTSRGEDIAMIIGIDAALQALDEPLTRRRRKKIG